MLTIPDWGGSRKRDTVIANPAWPEIESAIRALNNQNLNDLYLHPEMNNAETYLCVGGGAGRYILTGAINNQSFPTLAVPEPTTISDVQLTVGGQVGDFPSNWIMDLSTTLQTAKAFYVAGGFDCGVTWQAS